MKHVDIEKLIDIDYATDERVARRKGSGGTQEFYTPYSIVKKMCDKIPSEMWKDSTKTFLEPCCGNGNFCLAIVYKRLMNGVSWKDALSTLYAVELMEDNVKECKERILNLFELLNIDDFDINIAKQILDRNIVCSDFFKWDFENWRPIPQAKVEELF